METGILVAALTALVAGLAGSGHCMAMCGGMAGLLAARRDTAGKPLRRTLTYNAGRITSYSIGGLLAGGLGQAIGIASGLDIAAGHLRVVSGAIIVLAGLYLLTGSRLFTPFEKLGERAWRAVSPLAVRQLKSNGSGAVFTLGMLWGWLPCGLTWSMLAIAAGTANAMQGGAIMLAFGLGTLPALIATGLAGLRIRNALHRAPVRRLAAIALIVAGMWTAAFPVMALTGQTSMPHEAHH